MTINEIFDAVIADNKGSILCKSATMDKIVITDMVAAVTKDPEAFAVVVRACWNNGAGNELCCFLTGKEVANAVNGMETARYCNQNPVDLGNPGHVNYLSWRLPELANQVGMVVMQIILARLHAIAEEYYAARRAEAA